MSEVRCPRCGKLVEAWTTGPLTCPSCGFTKTVKPAVIAPVKGSRTKLFAILVTLIVLGGAAATALVLIPGSPFHPKGALQQDAALQAAVAGTLALQHDATHAWSIEVRGNENLTRAAWSPKGPVLESSLNDTADFPGSGTLQQGTVVDVLSAGTATGLARDEKPRPEDTGPAVFRAISRVFAGARVNATPVKEMVEGRPLTRYTAEGPDWAVRAWAMDRPVRIVRFNATGSEGVLDGLVEVGTEVRVAMDTSVDTRVPFEYARNETTDDADVVISGRIGPDQRYEVKLSEVELRVADGGLAPVGDPVASLRLDHGHATGAGYTLTYTDVNKDGLLSAGDTYEVKRPSDSVLSVWFFDLWADDYATDTTA